LTSLTTCGGCGAKLGTGALAEALAGLSGAAPAQLIAGLSEPDDAAVYRINDDQAIIGTVDFFPPLVDDPSTFGEIAAANAMSDVFAMGGEVLFGLSIAAFPEALPREILVSILSGASDKVREAGGTLAGGHTIRDAEPKYGLAVIGLAHPDQLLRKGGLLPGDALLLTKRLGTGLIISGNRSGAVSTLDLSVAVKQMKMLNLDASRVLVRSSIAGATDVTGFGLLGHGLEMARAAGVRVVFETSSIPILPGAYELAASGLITDGGRSNQRFTSQLLSVASGVDPAHLTIAHDPQTSGGLLAGVPRALVNRIDSELDTVDIEHWWIGRVESGPAGLILV
jgi:selenide,water dikinase